MTDARAPLTPADCDLRDFHRMMIDIPRLRGSSFDASPDDAAWRAGLNLWMTAFHSVPAASLDDDEGTLCKASGLGRDLRTFRKVRAAAMRGWILCSDGRWYHEVVAEMALEAWLGKLGQRLSSGAGNAKRHGTTFDPEPVRAAIEIAAGLLAELNPASKSLPKVSRHISQQTPDGKKISSRRDAKSVPMGSLVEETETGEETQKLNEGGSGAASQPPPPALVPFIEIPTNRFETASEQFPVYEPMIEEYQRLYPAVDIRAELRKMRGWSIANQAQRKTRKGMGKFINAWLSRQQDKPVARETFIGGRNGSGSSNRSQSGASTAHQRHIEGLALLVDEDERKAKEPGGGPGLAEEPARLTG